MNTFKNLSKTKQLEYELLQDIASRNLKAHDRFLSEREIVETYEINQMTVRQTLGRLVEQGVLYRLNGKGTFVSPPLRNQPLLIVSKFNGESLATGRYSIVQFLLGLHTDIADNNLPFIPITLSAEEFDARIQDLKLIYRRIAGVIFFVQPESYAQHTQQLDKQDISHLYYGPRESLPDEHCHALVYTQSIITKTALDGLLSAGFTRPGILYASNSLHRVQRRDAFLEACRQRHIVVPPTAIFDESDTDFANKLFTGKRQEADCFFCVDDNLAMRFMNRLYQTGMRCPEDYGLIGVNNYPFCENLLCPLTTVAIPYAQDAGRSLAMLASLQSTGQQEIAESSVSLIKRRSTQF